MTLEQKIAEHLTIILKRKGLSQKDFLSKGVNQSNYQTVLQIGSKKGKTYTLKTLAGFLEALGETSLKVDDLSIRL